MPDFGPAETRSRSREGRPASWSSSFVNSFIAAGGSPAAFAILSGMRLTRVGLETMTRRWGRNP